MVDDEDLYRSLCRFQPEARLLLERPEKPGTGGRREGTGRLGIYFIVQRKVVSILEPGSIEHRTEQAPRLQNVSMICSSSLVSFGSSITI